MRDPGERDRPVTIQQLTDSVAGSGLPKETWTTLVHLAWMRKTDVTGTMASRERFTADQLSARLETEWEMAYRADMDPELVDVAKTRRLSYQGRIYDITAASQIGRRDGIWLRTLAKVG